eukprot:1263129-Alexandrium_andersonii.AAC.1
MNWRTARGMAARAGVLVAGLAASRPAPASTSATQKSHGQARGARATGDGLARRRARARRGGDGSAGPNG